jgi:hypothetical protein
MSMFTKEELMGSGKELPIPSMSYAGIQVKVKATTRDEKTGAKLVSKTSGNRTCRVSFEVTDKNFAHEIGKTFKDGAGTWPISGTDSKGNANVKRFARFCMQIGVPEEVVLATDSENADSIQKLVDTLNGTIGLVSCLASLQANDERFYEHSASPVTKEYYDAKLADGTLVAGPLPPRGNRSTGARTTLNGSKSTVNRTDIA